MNTHASGSHHNNNAQPLYSPVATLTVKIVREFRKVQLVANATRNAILLFFFFLLPEETFLRYIVLYCNCKLFVSINKIKTRQAKTKTNSDDEPPSAS